MLGNCSAVAFCNCCNCVTVCIITKCRYFVLLCPCIEHRHSHTIVVRYNNIDLITKRCCPSSNCITSSSCIPCSTCWVLHFLCCQLTDGIFFSIYLDSRILNDLRRTICICSDRRCINYSISLNASSQCRTNTTCTCDGIVMSDITNC